MDRIQSAVDTTDLLCLRAISSDFFSLPFAARTTKKRTAHYGVPIAPENIDKAFASRFQIRHMRLPREEFGMMFTRHPAQRSEYLTWLVALSALVILAVAVFLILQRIQTHLHERLASSLETVND